MLGELARRSRSANLEKAQNALLGGVIHGVLAIQLHALQRKAISREWGKVARDSDRQRRFHIRHAQGRNWLASTAIAADVHSLLAHGNQQVERVLLQRLRIDVIAVNHLEDSRAKVGVACELHQTRPLDTRNPDSAGSFIMRCACTGLRMNSE